MSPTKSTSNTAAGAQEAPARGPGRPRSAEAHERILWAALSEVGDSGYRALTIEAVAARAKVGKTTIYRRWPSKRELVQDAIPLIRPPAAGEDQGSLDADFGTWVAASRAKLAAKDYTPLTIARLLAEAIDDAELHAFVVENLIDHIRAGLGTIIERAVDRGELGADLDIDFAIDVLHGTVVYRTLISGGDIVSAAARFPQVLALLKSAYPPG